MSRLYYMNVFRRFVKMFRHTNIDHNHNIIPNNNRLSNSSVVPPLHKMKSPFDKDGKWIGWSAEEVAEHFARVRASTEKVEDRNYGRCAK